MSKSEYNTTAVWTHYQVTVWHVNHYTWYLVWFYGISTIVGYLMPNTVFTYTLNIWFVNTFCRYTQLNNQSVLFLTIQFSKSFVCTQFKYQQFYLTHRYDPIRCYHSVPECYSIFFKAPALLEPHHQIV